MKNITIIFLIVSNCLLAQKTNKTIDSLIAKMGEEYNIPAISASLITPKKIYYGIYGTTKVNGNKKVNLHSKFHLGSNTKAITSFIAMKMVEKGQIKLTTKLTDIFPELKPQIRTVYKKINLEQLLSHNAHIQSYTQVVKFNELPKFKGSISKKRYEFTKFVLNEKPVELGTYSNAGYIIASLMLEKKSGLSFEELVKKYLTELKMDYFFGFPNKETDDNPAGHWIENGELVSLLPNHSYKLEDFMLSAGDLSMNIIDYSKFIQLNLKGLKKGNFLTKESYHKIHFGRESYSLGWGNMTKGNRKFSFHNGSAGTYYCHVTLSVYDDVAIVIMSNSAMNEELYTLRNQIFDNAKKIKE